MIMIFESSCIYLYILYVYIYYRHLCCVYSRYTKSGRNGLQLSRMCFWRSPVKPLQMAFLSLSVKVKGHSAYMLSFEMLFFIYLFFLLIFVRPIRSLNYGSLTPWYVGNDTAERNEKAKKAYSALLTVTARTPNNDAYRNFSVEVSKNMKTNENKKKKMIK